ncbi:G2/M phase-specific E3 ubiquitin-protein ligase-like [Gymnodraco acuticeps]|uniref:G2/M phase-specific E3 ubiquitin-protein ligase-like n=1 Tax=Gymnodraco acuticeps TaxID=8218 RepID=A0A6P8TKY4_GYMAC|nr:G2/M phase-specific E3 ubiquitin-protein ligase-like [Gymnodraco acuticeps]
MQVWDIPNVHKVSTPRMDNSLPGMEHQPHSRKRSSLPRVRTTSIATTQLCIIIDSQSEPEDEMEQTAEQSTEYLTAEDIVAELSAKITNTSCSRFNMNRANVWDGAIRGFKGASFDPSHETLVKFTDDEGHTEDGGDTGGPKREFLTLLMECLRMKKTSRQQLFVPHGGCSSEGEHQNAAPLRHFTNLQYS